MDARAHIEKPDSVGVTLIVDMSVWELRKVLETMEQITHSDSTPFWILKGHLSRLLNRLDEAVFSHAHEEKK